VKATVYTDLDNLSLILDFSPPNPPIMGFSPPNPPIMGGIGIESPPKLGDLGGDKVFNYNTQLWGELELKVPQSWGI
jgi:hypothetical protein